MNTLPLPWLIPLTVLWLILFAAGKWQLNQIKTSTFELALQEGRGAKQQDPAVTVEQLFPLFISKWRAMLPKKAWFVLHKTELWPVPIRADELQQRLNLTPAWLGAYLALHGIKLPAEAELARQIESILLSAPAHLRGRRAR